ncbi:MAG: hypothetical protein LBC94_09745 [Desulfovibrio sp.]|jgi:hypothetical protein|nr:hypothetical protein [Desulfovibrio sp.]
MTRYAFPLALALIPITLVCLLSLPLILLGFIKPDPHPWNWLSIYMVDFLFGLLLLAHIVGFLRRCAWSRLLTAALGGYAALAFGQTALEMLLDIAGIQAAPVTNRGFILAFMLYGFTVAAAMLFFAFRFPEYWFRFGRSDV